MVTVTPKDGLNVRHPETGLLMTKTICTERTPAIIRMIKDGDLILEKQKKKKPAAKKSK